MSHQRCIIISDSMQLTLTIDGSLVSESVCMKYLGTLLTPNLDWTPNMLARVTKARQRLYILKCLRYIDVDFSILKLCCDTFISSTLNYHLPVYHTSLSVKSRAKLRPSNCQVHLRSRPPCHRYRAGAEEVGIQITTR